MNVHNIYTQQHTNNIIIILNYICMYVHAYISTATYNNINILYKKIYIHICTYVYELKKVGKNICS